MRKIIVVAAVLTLGAVAGLAYPFMPSAYACSGYDHP